MARKRRLVVEHPGELNLVAMIDVAFQLLNYFIISSRPLDVLANLDILRPEADDISTKEEEPPQMLEILVHRDGYAIQKRNVGLAELDRQLTRLGGSSRNVSVVIKCTGNSPHAGLVNVLDVCAKVGLTKLAVFSM
ncbi:MAG: biopolymer transporter ExbD [Verrucomicrobia bacterium]|nr:biopolymer transporter ExbD [Verrucomicrobiota bacterium]